MTIRVSDGGLSSPQLMEQMVDLKADTVTDGGAVVVRIAGDLDVYAAPALLAHFVELLRFRPPQLVVDMEGVTFIDSSGLNVLFGVLKRVRAFGGTMHLACSHVRIVALFRITGLPKDFPVHDTTAQAVAAADLAGRTPALSANGDS